MIIVKTSNGDRFINEVETLQVSHVKDKSQVDVWPSKLVGAYENPQVYTIENVESVIYTNAAQATEWKDEGSEVEKLRKADNVKKKYIDQLWDQLKAIKEDLIHFAFDMEQIVDNYHGQIPTNICKQIRDHAGKIRSNVLNGNYGTYDR